MKIQNNFRIYINFRIQTFWIFKFCFEGLIWMLSTWNRLEMVCFIKSNVLVVMFLKIWFWMYLYFWRFLRKSNIFSTFRAKYKMQAGKMHKTVVRNLQNINYCILREIKWISMKKLGFNEIPLCSLKWNFKVAICIFEW